MFIKDIGCSVPLEIREQFFHYQKTWIQNKKMYSYLGLDCINLTLPSDTSTSVHQMAEDHHIISKVRRSLIIRDTKLPYSCFWWTSCLILKRWKWFWTTSFVDFVQKSTPLCIEWEWFKVNYPFLKDETILKCMKVLCMHTKHKNLRKI